jgi:hypothetical protein
MVERKPSVSGDFPRSEPHRVGRVIDEGAAKIESVRRQRERLTKGP